MIDEKRSLVFLDLSFNFEEAIFRETKVFIVPRFIQYDFLDVRRRKEGKKF